MPVLWFNIGDMKKFAALVFASSILAIALCACASSAIGPNENLSGEVSDGRPVFQNEDLKKTYKNLKHRKTGTPLLLSIPTKNSQKAIK